MAGSHAGPRPCVLVAAGRADWEPEALGVLREAGIVVVRRCVDLADLLAAAAAGTADVAVVAGRLPGLDADAVRRLGRAETRVLAVLPGTETEERERLGRLGITLVGAVAELPSAVEALVASAPAPPTPAPAAPERQGRVVAVWGPAGAPGRTTVAVTLAAERAAAGRPVLLLDADPYGGTVAQQLGVLDEVSGLLAAARLANRGTLERTGLGTCCRRVGERLDVLTGLPRADRWIEVREGVLERLVELAVGSGDVVVDCGFSLEDTGPPESGRNAMTLEALTAADEIVLVGSADPTGLSRLARALVDLGDVVVSARPRVVVNRMRDTLGWRRADVVGMIEGYAPGVEVFFVPEDRVAVDRALVAGRSLAETGPSALRTALLDVGAAVFPDAGPAPVRRRRWLGRAS